MVKIPKSHPRRNSLLSRNAIVDATKKGLLADSALIAHGRGEAFDYSACNSASASLVLTTARGARHIHCIYAH